ncbi:aldehyde dehydrogenase family protein [Acrocarpospora macrocephala]|uniref:Aldehyde dehydrogenase n=1 Tax=Acrocarpospora macrocephala TaxID=150177 RepID=A0A5M3WQN8_9ACTN|nr:aldehyde dehydrogenase family protein [Acrocarpospora macrocephala]GES09601.1 aldehyde dehydrogenase [Acrocarpospora macrocephala]
MAINYTMTLNGRQAEGVGTFGVRNPATGEVFAEVPEASATQVDQAMSAALRIPAEWRTDRELRAKALHEVAAVMRVHAEDLARAITCEMGKPLAHAMREVAGGAAYFDYYADLDLPVTTIRDDGKVRLELRRRPVGPVAAITPWNGPIILMAAKVAPALAAGNPVILKPSPYSPVSALTFGDLVRELLPPGVFAVLTGSGDLGRWVTEHPAVRKVTFTGSIAVGKQVAVAAARDLKRVTLELGGNDPVIALDDVDAQQFAERVATLALVNAGQICIAPKRIYVPASRHDEIVDALVASVRGVRVGDGLDPGTVMGPIANKAQHEFVAGLVREVHDAGGQVISGQAPDVRGGHYYPPTVVTGVGKGMRVVDEEQFGPVIPVIRYTDVHDAIEQANSTMYGLGSSVWSADLARAEAIADRLEAGTSWINTHFASIGPEQTLSGVKWSGIGVEGGRWGLEEFTDPHLRYVDLAAATSHTSTEESQ